MIVPETNTPNPDDYCNGLDVGAIVRRHDWTLGLLGTGTEKCTKCGATRARSPRENPEEEKRLQYAEEGFRNGAKYIAEAMDALATESERASDEAAERAQALRSAAKHAHLIGKGRDGK